MSLISKEAIDLLHYRIEQEELSSRLYEQMSYYLTNQGYLNFGKLYKKFATEEMSHAMWAKDYLLSFGITPILPVIEAPISSFEGLPSIIEITLEHESNITQQCKNFGLKAMQLGDLNLFEVASQYNKEQIEEMDKAITLNDFLKTFGTDKQALLILETHLKEYYEL